MAENKIKVGGIVRFLNAVGGGRVSRIVKDMAYVEDEDGFEIPTPLAQCVLVSEGDTFVPAYNPPKPHQRKRHEREEVIKPTPELRKDDFLGGVDRYYAEGLPSDEEEDVEMPLRAPHTFVPAKGEVELLLAFLPEDLQHLGQTNFEAYLINDCDYSLYYVYSTSADGEAWRLRAHGYVEPHTKIFVHEFASLYIDDHRLIDIQAIALAENPGIYKASYALMPKIEGKLLKTKSFVDNPFFGGKAYVLPLVVASQPKATARESVLEALNRSFAPSSDISQQAQSLFAPKEEKMPSVVRGTENEQAVIDLHASELLENTVGMNAVAILDYQIDYFRKVMDSHLASRGKKLIFIHGKGNGTLRNRLLRELRKRYPRCKSQDASFVEYGYGATQVIIY